MIKGLIVSCCRHAGFSTLAALALCLQNPFAAAQGLHNSQSYENGVKQGQRGSVPLDLRVRPTIDSYILGPGDSLEIELLDLPELSGIFSIGPDGTLYLPRLRSLYVEGLTVEHLRQYLTQKFRTYILDPQVYVRPIVYRPIRIYVGGEVKRPGYYTLTGSQFSNVGDMAKYKSNLVPPYRSPETKSDTSPLNINSPATLFSNIPTVFDAIRSAQGVTPYSDLAQVEVTRKRSEALGGGKIRTTLNFLSLITKGDESQNIRLFDGDVVRIGRSKMVMREQLLKAIKSNLSPRFIKVFVSGRVKNPGAISVPHGSSVNQAIAIAGGADLIKGKVEFVHFTQEGETKRQLFNYDSTASAGTHKNPLLSAGDVIRIQDSVLSATTTVLNEITAPAVGIYSIFSLVENF